MCHSLAFDEIGGTIRTLRHGSPAQVIGDMRALYRAGGPQRPPELSAGARALPGDVAQIRAAVQYRPRPRQPRQPRRPGDPPRLLARAAPASIATRWCSRRRARSTTASARSPSRPAICCTAGSTIATHQIMQRPGQPRLAGRGRLRQLPWRRRARIRRSDLLLPDLASCRDCHGGEHSRAPVASTCAMCHDYHMDGGTPAMLLRQRVRGRRWETTVIRIDQPRGGEAVARCSSPRSPISTSASIRAVPDELNRQRLDRTLARARRDEPAARSAARHRRHRRQWRRRRLLPRFREAIADLPFPVYPAMGNHDSRGAVPRRYSPTRRRRTASSNMRSRICRCASSSSTRSRSAATAAAFARRAPPG